MCNNIVDNEITEEILEDIKTLIKDNNTLHVLDLSNVIH